MSRCKLRTLQQSSFPAISGASRNQDIQQAGDRIITQHNTNTQEVAERLQHLQMTLAQFSSICSGGVQVASTLFTKKKSIYQRPRDHEKP